MVAQRRSSRLGLRVRDPVAGRVRDALAETLRVRLRVRLRVWLRVRDALGVPAGEPLGVPAGDALELALAPPPLPGGSYRHHTPLVTGAPRKPPSCTWYTREPTAVSTAVDAPALGAQSGAPGSSRASSLPTRQLKGSAHVGQPVPTYSTVLLAVSPHVLMVSVPPSCTPAPSDRNSSARGPTKNVDSPLTQLPDECSPATPAAPARSNASAAVEPASPLSVVMGLRAAPHMLVPLGDGVAVRVRVGVVVRERLPLLEGVPVGDAVGVAAAVSDADVDGVSVGDADSDAVADAEPVAESVLLGVPDAEPVPVAERVDDPVAGGVAEAVGVTLRLGGNACASDRPPLTAPARTGRPRTRPPVARRPASAAIAASQLPAAAAPPPGTALRSTPLRDCMSGISPVTLEKSTQLASGSVDESMLPHAESAACPSGAAA